MACTFYFKGQLKNKYKTIDLFGKIIDCVDNTTSKYELKDDELLIIRINDQSEPILLQFDNKCVNFIAKIELSNYDDMLEIIYSLKNMFYIFQLDDDYGIWNDFLAKKNPCKIKLRELTSKEEKFMRSFGDGNVSSQGILLGIIGMDIRKNKEDIITYQYLVDNINHNIPSYTGYEGMEIFEILETWVYDTMSYKDYGKVCEIDKKTRGLITNLQSFSFSIAEIIFEHYGGSIGEKHSQIRKLYEQEIYNKKLDIEKDRFLMYRFVLSVLDYLGFSHN